MGYTTDFSGEVKIEPPLNEAEQAYLRKFAGTRRMDREQGPYFVDDPGDFGQNGIGSRDYNAPPEGQPGLWCQWVPNEDGDALEWDGGEKFYEAAEWMAYLIDHFLKPGAEAFKSSDPQFNKFTFDHACEGFIEAQGEDPDDRWAIRVTANEVETLSGLLTYTDANGNAVDRS